MDKGSKDEEVGGYKGWYSKNKAELSERRKLKYRSDQLHRQAVIERQREYRADHPAPSRAGKADTRMVNGREVRVVRIGEASALIGRTDQTIRDWEARGIIPLPSVEAAHRYYTMEQVSLMKGLADTIQTTRSSRRKDLVEVVEEQSRFIYSNWNN